MNNTQTEVQVDQRFEKGNDKLSRVLKKFINIDPTDQILSAYSKVVIRKACKIEPRQIIYSYYKM